MYYTNIMLYHIILSVRYYPRFHGTAVGLGTYYPRIQHSVCIFIKIWSFTCSGKLTCNSKTRQMYMPVYCTWMVIRFDQNQGFANPWCWVAVRQNFALWGILFM